MAMAATSRLAAFKDAIVDTLLKRDGLSGVQVTSADVGGNSAAHESIQLIGEDMIEQEWAQIGRFSRDETLILTGAIFVKVPGKGEAIIRQARSRVFVLMAEVEAAFTGTLGDPSMGGVVRSALARPAELMEIVDPDGRIALLRFEIKSGKTRLQST